MTTIATTFTSLSSSVKKQYLTKASKYRKYLIEACNGNRPMPTTKIGVWLMKDCVQVKHIGDTNKKVFVVVSERMIARSLYDFDIKNYGLNNSK